MKRIVTVLLTALALTASNAQDLRTLFVSMPDSITPTLTRSDRMDFLDYMDSGMKARVNNKLGGESRMTRLEDNVLTVETSQSGRLDMVLLKTKKGRNLICIIRTASAKYEDSRLCFYTEDWQPVPVHEFITPPQLDDYLTRGALKSDSLDVFKKRCMLRLQSVTPVGDSLEFRYTSLADLGQDAERYESWFKPEPLVYTWNGKRFRRK